MVTQKDVQKVAHLARLRFTEAAELQLAEDMNRILAYMEKLNELDTENVVPLTHVFPIEKPLREDKVIERISHEEALKNAPDADQNYFRVPKVIE